jgi:hypothetical protein
MEYYLTIKNKIMSFAGKWMELVIIMWSEISRTRKTNITYFLSYTESKFKKDIKVEAWLLGKRVSPKKEGRQERYLRMNMIKVHYIHVWKCHNKTHYFI